jgi:hypothetical protein
VSRRKKELYILFKMRFWRLVSEPEVYLEFEEARRFFEEYTRTSWDEVEWLAQESGADRDLLIGGPFAGSTIVTVEVPWSCCTKDPQ